MVPPRFLWQFGLIVNVAEIPPSPLSEVWIIGCVCSYFGLLCRIFSSLKGTVIVILSDTLYKDGNARFTTVPLKFFSDQL